MLQRSAKFFEKFTVNHRDRRKPTAADIQFMRHLETEFRSATNFVNRSQYKIFYSPIWRAKILLLGINPGGDPDAIAADGANYRDGSGRRAASSTTYTNGPYN